MKKYNLIWSRAWIDQINRWIKGFSFLDFEDKIQNSRGNFSLFFWWNLDFKHSRDAKMSLEEEEINKFKD